MSDGYERDPGAGRPNPEERETRVEDIRRVVIQGASEAQQRLRRLVNKANDYWQQAQEMPMPRQAENVEEQRLRQLANEWSNSNWRVTKELGTYMDIVSWESDEVWEVTVQTRMETRNLEIVSEPYTGRPAGSRQPILPVWDYDLPEVVGLKPSQTRTRLEGLTEVVSCTTCNSTGHVLCSTCAGRGWIVCPDCKGRTKKRCTTCRGRGYVSDATPGEKKPFLRQQAENVVTSMGSRVSDLFENIRQQGVPIPNPIEADPAAKGPTIPCPDCVNGEVDCTCGTGKRVCPVCQGAKTTLCSTCRGTGKLVRAREITRRFELQTQTQIVGASPIPQQSLLKAEGDLLYNAEVNETLHPAAPPENVPLDVWHTTVELVNAAAHVEEKRGTDAQSSSRATLQVVELVRIPYTSVYYRYGDQDYALYIYDSEGKEKFYAPTFPARWDRVERLVKAISSDLLAPTQQDATFSSTEGYRPSSIEHSYNISEEDEGREDDTPKTP